MSPSAVSRAVARLEEDLGIRLLQRTTRSLTLTEDGTKYFERCQQILDELEAAELEIKQSRSIPTRTLRLNLSIAILVPRGYANGKMYITPLLPEFVATIYSQKQPPRPLPHLLLLIPLILLLTQHLSIQIAFQLLSLWPSLPHPYAPKPSHTEFLGASPAFHPEESKNIQPLVAQSDKLCDRLTH
jgi:Bacterial regulatory helix-turn-helix protein, lysR family